jgi:hypothetical protein
MPIMSPLTRMQVRMKWSNTGLKTSLIALLRTVLRALRPRQVALFARRSPAYRSSLDTVDVRVSSCAEPVDFFLPPGSARCWGSGLLSAVGPDKALAFFPALSSPERSAISKMCGMARCLLVSLPSRRVVTVREARTNFQGRKGALTCGLYLNAEQC